MMFLRTLTLVSNMKVCKSDMNDIPRLKTQWRQTKQYQAYHLCSMDWLCWLMDDIIHKKITTKTYRL